MSAAPSVATETASTTPAEQTLPRANEVVWPFPRMRVRRRAIAVSMLILAAIALAVVVEVGAGAYVIPIDDVVRVFVGGGTELQRTTVLDWRMPRALVGLGVGLALGAAGAVTQSLARNPLASPDLLGVAMGSSAAAVAVLVFAPAGIVIGGLTFGVPWAAFAGGIGVAVVVAVLAYRGGIDSMRLVLIGVGVNTFAGSVVSMLLVQTDLAQAADAVAWLTGSLDNRTWNQVGPLWITIAVSAIVLAVAAFDFRVTHLGDSMARGLGVPITLTLPMLWCSAVLLTAASVAAAGPISFVALAAPQLARLIYRSATPPVIGGALLGALLMLCADLAARYVLGGSPVGIVTAALGAPFLLYLLIRNNRKVTL
ncbi:iron chelate uptake ABC transporter family permease subunit [Gordonia sinesedis]